MISQVSSRVFVGLSGGVDSAVSAALLKKAGYDVTGVFIKVWQPDWIECNWKEERLEAMRVAAHLSIPFITLDLEKEYKKDVIDYMIAEYQVGRTPNPDVMCNRYVKFGAFSKWAKAEGADYIATGHYAQIGGTVTAKDHARTESFSLGAGVDINKDQSYFLWTLNQGDLEHVLFPVGHLTKPEVRKLAAKFRLPNADKKDSQGLCFIGKVDVKEFLSRYISSKPGRVLDQTGDVIGIHPGAMFFTIGERHGFSIFDKDKASDEQPMYVSDKDTDQNTITVSRRIPSAAGTAKNGPGLLEGARRIVRIGRVNWVSGTMPDISHALSDDTYPLQARSRYRQPLQRIRINSANISETTIEFETAQDTLTAGQSLVIYDGDNCLGGGIIED